MCSTRFLAGATQKVQHQSGARPNDGSQVGSDPTVVNQVGSEAQSREPSRERAQSREPSRERGQKSGAKSGASPNVGSQVGSEPQRVAKSGAKAETRQYVGIQVGSEAESRERGSTPGARPVVQVTKQDVPMGSGTRRVAQCSVDDYECFCFGVQTTPTRPRLLLLRRPHLATRAPPLRAWDYAQDVASC